MPAEKALAAHGSVGENPAHSPDSTSGMARNGVDLTQVARSLEDEMDGADLDEAARLFAENDPLAGIKAAARFKDGRLREHFLKTLFAWWGKTDGRSATTFILHAASDAELGGVKRGEAMVSAAMGWGEKDPVAAAAWLGEGLRGNAPAAANLIHALAGVMGEWGGEDPTAALIWLGRHNDFALQRVLYGEVAFHWARKDVTAALAACLEMPLSSDEREGMLNGALVSWARGSGPAEAAAWIDAHLDSREILRLAETAKAVGLALERKDPNAALAWANTMPDDGLRTDMMSSITFPWIHDAPATALGAVQDRLPSGDPVRTEVVVNTVRAWSHLDAAKAADWLAAQPAGVEHDRSLQVYADAVSVAEPQKAATWATSIQDPATREVALTQVMREWIQTSPKACAQWCDEQALKLGQPFVDRVKQMIAER